VVEHYGGEVPADPERRRALPGVGRYTAGAIGSICFDREEPVVDGNVARVLSRVFAIDHPLGSSAADRALWARAGELVRGERPGDLNQALMELGARVCTPRSPRCEACPIASECAAEASARQDELPVAKKRKEPLRVETVAVVATRRDGGVALVRSERALFGGLHAPPMMEGRGRDRARAALRSAGVRARLEGGPAGRVEHVLSHRVLDVEVWRADRASSRTSRIVGIGELSSLGISTLTRRILAAALR
jgi:A/G-specific adenine glycosylase